MKSTSLRQGLSLRLLDEAQDLVRLRDKIDLLVLPGQPVTSPYTVGFASSKRCVDLALALRYRIFNLELGEGLSGSEDSGLDRDCYDDQMTHVVVIHNTTEEIVGTYRVQTMSNALSREGIYSAEEYDLTALEPFFHSATECGRACIARGHRNSSALYCLWKGIRDFMRMYRQRWVFGCCSITSTDPQDGWRAMKTIRKNGFLHDSILAKATSKFSCGDSQRELAPDLGASIPLPKLFAIYMKLGCKVISEPALDKEFGTVDFLVMLDARGIKLSSLDVLG